MSKEKDNKSKFNQYMKSDKIPYIIYADIEFSIKKIDGCGSNPENFSTTKVDEYNPCCHSVSTIWRFDPIENKHNLYRGRDFMKRLFDSLKENAKNTIDFEKKENVTVSKKRIKITRKCNRMLYLWKSNPKKSQRYKFLKKQKSLSLYREI